VSSPYHPCPFCFHPNGMLVKPTKRSTFYARCSACMAVTFLNSDLCFTGMTLARYLVEAFGMDQLRAEVSQGESMLKVFVGEKVPSALPSGKKKEEVSHAGSPPA